MRRIVAVWIVLGVLVSASVASPAVALAAIMLGPTVMQGGAAVVQGDAPAGQGEMLAIEGNVVPVGQDGDALTDAGADGQDGDVLSPGDGVLDDDLSGDDLSDDGVPGDGMAEGDTPAADAPTGDGETEGVANGSDEDVPTGLDDGTGELAEGDEEEAGEDTVDLRGAQPTRYAEVVTPKGTLNMRAKDNDTAEILQKLPRGTIVEIVESGDEWTLILYREKTGYVSNSFIEEVEEYPYPSLTTQDEGDAVLEFKRALRDLGYIKTDDINPRFDKTMELALTKLQLMNGIALNPTEVTPELQALMEWGKVLKCKSGYINTATDPDSGLTVSVFCWDSGGMLYEDDLAVRLDISYAAQASGGQPPYTVTVKKSVSGGGADYADPVDNPFTHIWTLQTDCIYLYAVATDSAGNTVTACTPFRYTIPERYLEED